MPAHGYNRCRTQTAVVKNVLTEQDAAEYCWYRIAKLVAFTVIVTQLQGYLLKPSELPRYSAGIVHLLYMLWEHSREHTTRRL